MSLEIRIGDRVAKVNLVSREGTKTVIDIDDTQYEVDAIMVGNGVYSILHNGKSFSVEMIPGDGPKNYFVNTFYNSHEVEVIDAQSRYLKSRSNGMDSSDEKIITTPMPGKIVKIPVKEGDVVTRGTTVIIISAMKMESEYKSPVDGVIKKIHVSEGDTIASNQPLVEIE